MRKYEILQSISRKGQGLGGNVLHKVPSYIQRPSPRPRSSPREGENVIAIYKRENELFALQKAGEIGRRVLEEACQFAVAGITTNELDRFVHDRIISLNAYPSPLGYLGFPKSVCTSINNVLCHGIPDDRPLQDGDIMNIDITVFHSSFHADTSSTVEIGNVDANGKKLVSAARQALEKGILACGPGQKFKEIGRAISQFANEKGLLVDPHFCGHGVGTAFHMDPTIEHCENDDDTTMKEGMVFTVEPILLEGEIGFVKWDDGWTCASTDGLRSAQFEHSLLVTKNGVQVLT